MLSNALISSKSAGRHFPRRDANPTPSNTPSAVVSGPDQMRDGSAGSIEEIVSSLEDLPDHELGRAVAVEVMAWRLVSGGFGEVWVDSEGEMTGYYNGRPFSPYRDRNALGIVWERIASLGLESLYIALLSRLIEKQNGGGTADSWIILCCSPDQACRAALMAVRATW